MAIEVLMLRCRGGDPVLARMAVSNALHRHEVREFNPDREDPHWGKQKLN